MAICCQLGLAFCFSASKALKLAYLGTLQLIGIQLNAFYGYITNTKCVLGGEDSFRLREKCQK